MKKDFHNPEYDAAEQELLNLLQKIQLSAEEDEETPLEEINAGTIEIFKDADTNELLPDTPEAPEGDFEEMPLIFSLDKEETPPAPAPHTVSPAKEQLFSSPNVPPVAKPRKKNGAAVLRFFFPQKGDPVREIVRKCVMLLALATTIVSMSCLLYFMVLEPQQVANKNNHFASLYNDKQGNEISKDPYNYPAGMQASFRQLYDVNKDIAGWLSYISNDADTFMNINLPVVHCDNNDKYLNHAFDGSPSRSGTLFFEASSDLSRDGFNKVNIIYGHNMASGQMFAPLNKLFDSVYRARAASTITLNTLYETQQYMVFAVIVCDEGAAADKRFGYLRNSFADDADFITYVNELRARSLYDYPVDVDPNDQLLILSTCTNSGQAKVSNGRLAVIARRVRSDEEGLVDTTRIVKNNDVIMPYAWYTAQKLKPHAFYTQADYHIPEDSIISTTGTTATKETSTTTGVTTTTPTILTVTTPTVSGKNTINTTDTTQAETQTTTTTAETVTTTTTSTTATTTEEQP